MGLVAIEGARGWGGEQLPKRSVSRSRGVERPSLNVSSSWAGTLFEEKDEWWKGRRAYKGRGELKTDEDTTPQAGGTSCRREFLRRTTERGGMGEHAKPNK